MILRTNGLEHNHLYLKVDCNSYLDAVFANESNR